MEQITLQWEPQRRTYSVGELNSEIRSLLGEAYDDIWVAGEISGTKAAASGHLYFTLKDGDSALRCVSFRNTARYLKFKPQDGVAVLARGRIEVYEARGEYQLMVEALEPQGHGALQFAFEQLKRKLELEGLFDAERKRPLPKFPQRIGIVTSPTGAVIRDLLTVLQRRMPGLHIRIYPALVQGTGAAEAVCRGLHYFSLSAWPDVVILARGGGSLEDLWPFNDEEMARAIAASRMPVISAVGHETDFTIADFVADLRAPTPSAAAEMVVPTRDELLDRVQGLAGLARRSVHMRLLQVKRRLQDQGVERVTRVLQHTINQQLRTVDDLEERLQDVLQRRLSLLHKQCHGLDNRLQRTDVRVRLSDAQGRWERARALLQKSMECRQVGARGRLQPLVGQLEQLSPLRVLGRGYAIVEAEGRVVHTPAEAVPGTRLQIRLAQGSVQAEVVEPES